MTVPRENGLVRFYVKPHRVVDLKEAVDLKETQPQSESTIEFLVEIASMIMKPYQLRSKHCDWWSLYSVRQPHEDD